jgi:hypothetical protein
MKLMRCISEYNLLEQTGNEDNSILELTVDPIKKKLAYYKQNT